MKNFIKFFEKSTAVTFEEPKKVLHEKSDNEIVEEIHQTFFTEVDRLLAEAKISKSLETNKSDLIDKAKRLRKLGFTSATETIEGLGEISRLDELERINNEKVILIQAIEYFSQKYPQYKFITKESIKLICNKYKLVLGSVDKYIGSVPMENLEHMEQFRIDDSDRVYYRSISFGSFLELISFEQYTLGTQRYDQVYNYHKSSLQIAAPITQFNMRDSKVEDFEIVNFPKDPVVFQPVCFANREYYLIVTAWGKESGDSLVVNEKLN